MSSTRTRSTAWDLRRARVRITVVAVALLTIVLTVGAIAIVTYYRSERIHEVDAQLRRAGRVAASLADVDTPPGLAEAGTYQLIDRDGAVLYASEALDGTTPLWVPGQPRGPHTVEDARLGSVRVSVYPIGGRSLALVAPLESVDRSVTSLRQALLVVLPAVGIALGLLVWWAVGRALRPVAAARAREEQLLADVSHELRSPIAGIRVLLETEPSAMDDLVANRRSALFELSRLESMATQLLQLTDERRSSSAARQPVDLDEIVQREVERFAVRGDHRIDASGVQPGQVLGVESALESLVDNLLSNALRHASSTVVTAVTERAETVELTVDDDGPGIPPPDREIVFDRFTRLDEARTRTDGGAGLGLSIARAVVEAHRGTIAIEDSVLGGARFVVRFPASTRAPGREREWVAH